jgi:uncharacterized protein (TIRG00374 family)
LASAPDAELTPPASAGGVPLWQALLGIAVSGAFLVWALKDVRLAEVGRHLRQADLALLLLSSATVTLTFPLRTIRWRILLAGPGGTPGFGPAWRALTVGFMANNVLPARAGEVVRCYAARRFMATPFSTALASVAVERIFDGIVILLLLALALAGGGPREARVGEWQISALAGTAAVVFGGALVFLLILARARERLLPPLERLTRAVLRGRAGDFAVRQLHHLTDGLGTLRSSRDAARVLAWTFAVWLTNAASYVIAYQAFRLQLPAESALTLQGVVALGVAVPQAPGFFGTFEWLSKVVLGLYGVPGEPAVSFAVGVHLCWFVPITAIGLVVLARAGLSLGALRGRAAAP